MKKKTLLFKLKITILFLTLFCLQSYLVQSQPVTFKKVFYSGNGMVYCNAYNNDNTFIISTPQEIYKLNSNGDILIKKPIDSQGKILYNKIDTTITIIRGGSFYIMVLTKVDTLFNNAMPYQIRPHFHINDNAVIQTFDNGYLIGGNRPDTALICKVSSQGNILWSRYFTPLISNIVSAIVQTADSGFVVCSNFTNANACLVKTDSVGNVLWAKSYIRGQNGYISSIVENPDGTLLISGYNNPINYWSSSIFLIKISSTGNVIWAKTFGNNTTFRNYPKIRKTPDGGYIILSTLVRSDAIYSEDRDDLVLIKTDANGDTLWTRAHGTYDVGVLEASDITVLHDGYLIAANTNNRYPYGIFCSYLIRSDSLGHTASMCEEYSPQIPVNNLIVNDSSIVISSAPIVIDTTLYPININTDNYVMYDGCYLNGVFEQIAESNEPLNIYPNPSNGLFTIEFNNSTNITTYIEVYNLNMQKIYATEIKTNTCNINITGYANGLYFVKVINNNSVTTGKIMLE